MWHICPKQWFCRIVSSWTMDLKYCVMWEKSEPLYPFWTTAHFQHFFCTVSPQRATLISQRIFPAGCDIFADMMSPSKISWLTKGNMKHVDVMLKINWVLIFNFGNLLGPFEWQLRSNLWIYWNKLPKG